jgi:hypothetical protein
MNIKIFKKIMLLILIAITMATIEISFGCISVLNISILLLYFIYKKIIKGTLEDREKILFYLPIILVPSIIIMVSSYILKDFIMFKIIELSFWEIMMFIPLIMVIKEGLRKR